MPAHSVSGPCSNFTSRSARDTTNCACGWSNTRHEETAARGPGYYLMDAQHDPGLNRYGPPLMIVATVASVDPDADRCFNDNHPRGADGVCLLDGGKS